LFFYHGKKKPLNLQIPVRKAIFTTLYNLFPDLVIMAKGKENRIVITLECTEAKKEGKPVSRYTTTKNKKNTTDRLILKKYNPNLQRHTLHKEIK
jgi:large subunit ribosomal protein L33